MWKPFLRSMTMMPSCCHQEELQLQAGGAIREFYKTYYADPSQLLSEDFSSTSLVLRDDLAVETAEYSGDADRGEKGKVRFQGKNLVVWKRQKNGSWKIFRDMWSSSASQ